MDIVSRLKTFMEMYKISSSQLADNCGISRPTVSQILNGRNKKISDELIGKIHDAYPELSVLWLMFGEGEITTNANIKISEPKNGDNFTSNPTQQSDFQSRETPQDLFFGLENILPEKSNKESEPRQTTKIEENAPHNANSLKEMVSSTLSSEAMADKKMTNIVVFYADNTFQTFAPKY